MKASLYRESPVSTEYLSARNELEKYPVYESKPGQLDPRFRLVPAGYVIEHADCWRLVKQGTAKAADDECRRKCGMSPEQVVHRYERQKALEAGQLTGDPEFDAPDPT